MNYIYHYLSFVVFVNIEIQREYLTCMDLDSWCGKVFSVRKPVTEYQHGSNKRSKQMSSDLAKRM